MTATARRIKTGTRSLRKRQLADRFPFSIALLLKRSIDPTRPVVRPTGLPLLARLAHTTQSTHAAPVSTAHAAFRSTAHVPESTSNSPIPERTAA